MKAVYILIVVFLLAGIVSAEIYIHHMKGAGFFEAPAISQTLWIIEWMLMLLTICIIGISIGWYMQEKNIQLKHERIGHLQMEKDAWTSKESHYSVEIDQLQKKLTKAQSSFSEDFKKWSREKDRLKEELISWQNYAEEARKKNSMMKGKQEDLEKEINHLRESERELKNTLEKTLSEKDGLQVKLTQTFTLPPKDDLKLINGIGPAIEKKLNTLGIYSFRQISEFTPSTIQEISQAIKFFPGRIERDNWVSQARNFEKEKRRQAE